MEYLIHVAHFSSKLKSMMPWKLILSEYLHIFVNDDSVSEVKIKALINYIIFEHLPLHLLLLANQWGAITKMSSPLSQSMRCYNQNVNRGSI